MNVLGKTLALVLLVLSMTLGTFAYLVFANHVDWGRRDPRLEYGKLVPSEIEKQVLAVKEAQVARQMAEAKFDQVQRNLDVVEMLWPTNHLEYERILATLRNANGPIQVRHIAFENGYVKIDPNTLRPVFGDEVVFVNAAKQPTKIDKSLNAYTQEYFKVGEQMDNVRTEMIKITEDFNKVASLINGEIDPKTNQKIKPGLYDLLDDEVKTMKNVKREIEELQPLRVRELMNREIMLDRQRILQQRVEELRNLVAKEKN